MSGLDCFNLCEESCVKCKTLKPDSKYCRYCDICKKECTPYINKDLDISNNDLSFNDISDIAGVKKYLIDNKYLQSFFIIVLTLAILVIFLSYDNFKQLNIIKSFFISENKDNLIKPDLDGIASSRVNLPTPNINMPTPSINMPIPNLNVSKINIQDNYKSIFLFLISVFFIFIGLNYIYGITLSDITKFISNISIFNINESINSITNATNSNTSNSDTNSSDRSVQSLLKVADNKVYNVSSSLYSYDGAKALCKSFGATLATPQQIFDSYKSGESWCKPSWSAGQNLLFPSQSIDVTLADRDKKTAGSCGKAGLNGYYEINPDQKHPVNCYGAPPSGVSVDSSTLARLQNTHNSSSYSSN